MSLRVFFSNLKRSRSSERVKCACTSSSWSTTLELRAFLCACRWKIFSSIVPVWWFYIYIKINEANIFKQFSHWEQPVDKALLLLPVSPNSSHGLVVVRRVPIRIEHHQAIGANQIEATATCLAAEHENEVGARRVVESLHYLITKFGTCLRT